MMILHKKGPTSSSHVVAQHPEDHNDQIQKTNPVENLTDLQNEVNALRDQVEGNRTIVDDQNEHEEQLEDLQAQLQTTQDQVHLPAETIQSFQSLQNEFPKFNETFMKL